MFVEFHRFYGSCLVKVNCTENFGQMSWKPRSSGHIIDLCEYDRGHSCSQNCLRFGINVNQNKISKRV